MPKLSDHQSNDFTKLSVEDVAGHFQRPIVVNEEGCWIWLGYTDKRGYARYSSTMVYALVWRMAGREIPMGHELRHQCSNRSCINPDHFLTGTHKQNMEDAATAGVMGTPRKVTDEQVAVIHKMMADGYTQREICAAIGVAESWFTKFKNGGFKYAKPIATSE